MILKPATNNDLHSEQGLPIMFQKRIMKTLSATIVLAFALTLSGCTASDIPLGTILGGAGGALDEGTVAAGLKEALHIGTDRSVITTSKEDGFFGNPLIRIPLPKEFETVASTLRGIGINKPVDEFELAMNRAAEMAAGEAKDVFWLAITEMTLSDAMGILNGGDRSATDYFYAHTSDRLRTKFRPIVTEKMQEVGVYNTYNELLDKYSRIPFVSKPSIDLDGHITEKALGGLFDTLAGEEKKIREDPAARTTALLRKVFG